MKYLAALLFVLIACAPVQQEQLAEQKDSVVSPDIRTTEEVVSPAQKAPEVVKTEEPLKVPPAPEVKSGPVFEPYTQLGCESLLSDDQFLSQCGPEVLITYKTGTNNCFINIKDFENERLTAGVTLTAYESADVAFAEFERRAHVLKLPVDSYVGQKVYDFPKTDRESINFVRGRFIVEVGSDTRLCDKDSLRSVANIVDNKLK